jgi:chaperonin GroEL
LTTATPRHLGIADKIIIKLDNTTFFTGAKTEAVKTRIKEIKSQLNRAKDDYTKTRLREHLSRLDKGVAIISVGCPTSAETKEKKLRIEDAVHSAAAAIRRGIVTGGGTAYCGLIPALKQFDNTGAKILTKSLPAITEAICENAGVSAKKFTTHTARNNFGYDAKTNKFRDLSADVIDPALVIINVIRNAVSAAAILLTTDGIIL